MGVPNSRATATSADFDEIKDDWELLNELVTGHHKDLISAAWKDSNTVTVTFTIVDDSTADALESTLDHPDFATDLNAKIVENLLKQKTMFVDTLRLFMKA